jgi:hypothetical protein
VDTENSIRQLIRDVDDLFSAGNWNRDGPSLKSARILVSQSYDLLVAWGAKPPKYKLWLYWLTGEVCLEWTGLRKSWELCAFSVIASNRPN